MHERQFDRKNPYHPTIGEFIKYGYLPEVIKTFEEIGRRLRNPKNILGGVGFSALAASAPFIFDQLATVADASSTISALPEGLLPQGSDGKVYSIQNGQKRWIISPEVFNCRDYLSSNVQGVSDSILAGIPNGPNVDACLKQGSDGRVFLVHDGQKQWITKAEVFTCRGYLGGDVQGVADLFLAGLTNGPNIDSCSSTLPDGSLPQGSDNKVYSIENEEKRWIISAEIFHCREYQASGVQRVSDSILASIPNGPNIDACLKGGSDGRVYLITGSGAFTRKQWITGGSIFACRGYRGGDIQWGADSLLAGLTTGPNIDSCTNVVPTSTPTPEVCPSAALSAVDRFSAPNTSDKVYTSFEPEKKSVQQIHKYIYEGVAFYLYKDAGAGRIPIYRLVNGAGRHLMTWSEQEKDLAQSQYGFTLEGIIGYAPSEGTQGAVPVYRLIDALGNYFWTMSQSEVSSAVANYGYSLEGQAGYGFAQNTCPPTVTPTPTGTATPRPETPTPSPSPTPSPTEVPTSPWPPEIQWQIDRLPVPNGLHLVRATSAPPDQSGCDIACYIQEFKRVWFVGMPGVVEGGIMAHEVCHADQDWYTTVVGGFPWVTHPVSTWEQQTQQGQGFIQALNAFKADLQSKGQPIPQWANRSNFEAFADMCGDWYFRQGQLVDTTNHPILVAYARDWLPTTPTATRTATATATPTRTATVTPSPTPSPTETPFPVPTPEIGSYIPWLPSTERILSIMQVPDGLRLVLAPSAPPNEPTCNPGCYRYLTRQVWKVGVPDTYETRGGQAHEVAHSHQHWQTIQAGLPFIVQPTSTWEITPHGIAFVSAFESFKIRLQNQGQSLPYDVGNNENFAVFISDWYDPTNSWAPIVINDPDLKAFGLQWHPRWEGWTCPAWACPP